MIGVVVVDFNSEPLTRKCLKSLIALGRRDLRFYVVDNGGRLDAEALASDFSGVTVLAPGTNLGFAGGYNVGIARAIADGAAYGLLMNPDAVAGHDFLAPMLAAMVADDRIGMACPTQLDDSGRVVYGGAAMNWWSGRPRMIPGRRLRGRGAGIDVPFVSGAAALLRLSAVAEVGPMEESYFLYFEDTDYTQAFRRAGWRTVYVPESEVMHSGSGVIGFRSETYVYYIARNRIRFMRRWGRWHHRFVFTIFNTAVRLPAMLAMYGIARLQPALAGAQLRGYIDGMLGVEGIR
jgi:GT2 family glycosyltransferase